MIQILTYKLDEFSWSRSKKLGEVEKEIADVQEVLINTKSKSLGERLLKREVEREQIIAEVNKYENVKKQPSKVLLLVNEYARALNSLGRLIRKKSPLEQKTAISLFLERIEVRRDEGVARCYFYNLPKAMEIDYYLPGSAERRVPQVVEATSGTIHDIHGSNPSKYIVIDFSLNQKK